jgi:hypothetical protein
MCSLNIWKKLKIEREKLTLKTIPWASCEVYVGGNRYVRPVAAGQD